MINSVKLKILIALFVVFVGSITGCGKKDLPEVDTQIPPVKVAVASSFMPTAQLLAAEFTTDTGIAVEFTNGSDKELVNMILNGGDYDVFMSSDVEHPQSLVEQGMAQAEGFVIYAYGIPALYTKQWKVHWTAALYLFSGQFDSLGIADPDNNPYGRAGIALLKNIDVYKSLENKIVITENEQVTLDQIKTRQIDSGFVAYSSLSDRSKRWAWIVPQTLYDPIGQGAVLITKDEINDSAKIWMGYLISDAAQSIIQQSGYGILNNQTVSSSITQ